MKQILIYLFSIIGPYLVWGSALTLCALIFAYAVDRGYIAYQSCKRKRFWSIFIGGITAAVLATVLWTIPQQQVERYQSQLNRKEFLDAENNARATLAQIIGGLVLLIGLYLTWRNIRVAEEGKLTERFSEAVELLGSEKRNVRLGGIYALERIARDSQKDHWTVIEVLMAYAREHSLKKRSEEQVDAPATDIHAALTVIGRRKWIEKEEPPYQFLDLK